MVSLNPPNQYKIGNWINFLIFQVILIQKDNKYWLNYLFYGGLKGWNQLFYNNDTWELYK